MIGSLAKFGRDHDLEVVIVSGDKDFAQIVAPFISMYDTMKDVRYDEQGVVDKWGVSPKQMIDYLALVGDSSDNIPGVRGIGPKGAQKLLAAYKTLSGIYEHIDDISAKGLKAKLVEKKEEAFLSRQLVTIKTDVDLGISLDNLKLNSVERESLRTILNELDFNTFEKKLIGEGANTQSSTSVNSFKNKNNISRVSAKSSSYKSEAVSERTVNLAQLGELVAPYSEVCAILSERGFFLGCGNDIYGVEAPLIEVGAVLGPKLLTWKGFDLKTVWRNIGMDTPIVPKMDLMLAAYVVRAANIESFDKVYEKYTGKKIPDLASGAQLYHCHLELEYQLLKKLKQVDGEKFSMN